MIFVGNERFKGIEYSLVQFVEEIMNVQNEEVSNFIFQRQEPV